MFNIIRYIIIPCIFFTYSTYILAAGVTDTDSTKAQTEMLSRVHKEAEEYARRIKISDAYIGYCSHEMHLHTYNHPYNGYIPFGVNYNSINSARRLESIISSREAYEKAYMILCLANSKNTLSKAEP